MCARRGPRARLFETLRDEVYTAHKSSNTTHSLNDACDVRLVTTTPSSHSRPPECALAMGRSSVTTLHFAPKKSGELRVRHTAPVQMHIRLPPQQKGDVNSLGLTRMLCTGSNQRRRVKNTRAPSAKRHRDMSVLAQEVCILTTWSQ